MNVKIRAHEHTEAQTQKHLTKKTFTKNNVKMQKEFCGNVEKKNLFEYQLYRYFNAFRVFARIVFFSSLFIFVLLFIFVAVWTAAVVAAVDTFTLNT